MADESENNVDEPTSATVFVGNLPDNVSKYELEELFSDIGPIKKCYIAEGETKGFAYITYALREDAEEAVEKIKSIKGQPVRIKISKSSQSNEKKDHRFRSKFDKRARIIVRNIPFKITPDALRDAFEKLGAVKEVVIPKKPDGKMLGFAFIQYQNIFYAKKAVMRMNGQKLLDRPIAVDWAVSKDRYNLLKRQPQQPEELEKNEGSDDGEDLRKDGKEDGHSQSKKQKLKDEEESSDSPSEADDSVKDDDDDDSTEDNSDDSAEDDDEESDSSKEMKHKKQNENRPPLKVDANDGCTLFIRNLSFDTTQENLKEALGVFGNLKYVLLCIDPNTEHPKGTAFARFFQKDDAIKCLTKACDESQDGGIVMDGRRLIVNQALSREEIQQMAKDKHKKEPKDKRNLYLSREGLVRPGTQSAEGLSQHDVDARLKVEAWKRRMLKNLDIFVSKVRLCVRNLPLSVDDDKLRRIFETAAGSGARITEARVMKDFRQGRPPNYMSKGFGFVRFTTHEAALAALRNTNNNPAIFAKDRRPIVEFSLESRKAIEAQQKRLEKSKEKLQSVKKGEETQFSRQDKRKLSNPQNKPNKKFKRAAKQMDSDQNQDTGQNFIGIKAERDKKVLPSHIGAKVRHKTRNPGTKPSKKPKISRKQLYGKYNAKNQSKQTKKSQKQPFPKKRKSSSKDEMKLRRLEINRSRKLKKMEKKPQEKRSKWFEN